MEKFVFSLENKRTIWYRTMVEIDAESLEDAIKQAKELGMNGMEEEGEHIESEMIECSDEYLSVEDNGGQPTEEIRVWETDEIIWDNVEGAK